jgi:hypothetical protein
MTQFELESRWITTEGIPGVNCRFSDIVRIIAGEYSGQTAEVISLISIEPEPIYVVEIFPPYGKSVVLPESGLEPTGSTVGRTLKLMPPGQKPFIKKRT